MGFAAIWIFYFHVARGIFTESEIIVLREVEWYIRRIGYCGVEIFIFLSGTGLVYAIRKESLKEYYFRRFIRVYPAFFLWITLSNLGSTHKMTTLEYIKRITFYANWMEGMLEYKWYIAAILMLYLWFPLYYSVLKKLKYPVRFTVILILVEFVLVSVFYNHIRVDLFSIIDRIPIFLIGVLAGYLYLEKGKEIKFLQEKLKNVYIVSMVIVILLSYYLHRSGADNWLLNVRSILNIYIAIGMCRLLVGVFEKRKESNLMKRIRNALCFVGTLSLEFYLTHELVSLKVQSYNFFTCNYDFLNKILELGACFFVSLIGAWVLAKIVFILFNLTKTIKSHILNKG